MCQALWKSLLSFSPRTQSGDLDPPTHTHSLPHAPTKTHSGSLDTRVAPRTQARNSGPSIALQDPVRGPTHSSILTFAFKLGARAVGWRSPGCHSEQETEGADSRPEGRPEVIHDAAPATAGPELLPSPFLHLWHTPQLGQQLPPPDTADQALPGQAPPSGSFPEGAGPAGSPG